jgi:hypothetical protein
MSRCPDCGERSPDTESFCTVCGACLRPPPSLPPMRIRGTTRPTIRLISADVAPPSTAIIHPGRHDSARRASALQCLIPLLGLLFGTLFVIGFAQLLAVGGLSASVLGPAAVLVGGALLAERAWVTGDLWRGLRGMLLWGGLLWLLDADGIVPWALPLLFGWCALHPRWYGRRH